MAKYLLIESRSPFDSPEVSNNYRLAADLKNRGNEVTLFLVNNGVMAARKGAESRGLSDLSGVTLLADSFSMKERALNSNELDFGVKAAELDVVVDALADGHKTIWC